MLIMHYYGFKYRWPLRYTMSHAKRDTEATPANAPPKLTPTGIDLDDETIEEIRRIVRKHIVATMIQEDEYGNWTIDMVTGDDE